MVAQAPGYRATGCASRVLWPMCHRDNRGGMPPNSLRVYIYTSPAPFLIERGLMDGVEKPYRLYAIGDIHEGDIVSLDVLGRAIPVKTVDQDILGVCVRIFHSGRAVDVIPLPYRHPEA